MDFSTISTVYLPRCLAEQTAALPFHLIPLTQPVLTERNVPQPRLRLCPRRRSAAVSPAAHTGLTAYLLTVCLFLIWVQRLYKAAGEDARHQYTATLGLPEFVRAKANADNLSEASLSPC